MQRSAIWRVIWRARFGIRWTSRIAIFFTEFAMPANNTTLNMRSKTVMTEKEIGGFWKTRELHPHIFSVKHTRCGLPYYAYKRFALPNKRKLTKGDFSTHSAEN
jgi:hypothetical protein